MKRHLIESAGPEAITRPGGDEHRASGWSMADGALDVFSCLLEGLFELLSGMSL